MSDEVIAHRWATAIFDIARDAGAIGRVTGEIRELAITYDTNSDLRNVLESSLVPEASREAILRDLASRMALHEMVSNTFRLLSRKRRLRALPKIARRLERLADEHEGLIRANVTSVAELAHDFEQTLRAEIETAMGKKVILTFHRDPSLLGGIITRIGDRVIDGSIRGKLRALSESLVHR